MPKLLLVCEYAALNGGERSMLATLPAVVAAGFDVSVVAPAEGPLARELAQRQIEVHPLVVVRSANDTFGSPSEPRPHEQRRSGLIEIIAHARPELIHANSLVMSRLVGPVAEQAGVPSLGHLRDILRLSPAAIADLNANRRLLAVSHATRDYHVAAGLNAERTCVLYNGVDLETFRPRSPSGYLHRELNLPASARLVAAIGQISLRKGFDVLLDAAKTVPAGKDELHFLIVGERHASKDEVVQFERDLHAAAESPPLAGRVHFLGRRDDVPRIMNEIDLLVHPARQEPLGRVLLEAAAAGVVIVATDVGGTAEIFPPESQAAVLVRPDSPQQMAAAIEGICGDSAWRRKLEQSARRRAEEAFDIRTAAALLVKHYHDVLECAGG